MLDVAFGDLLCSADGREYPIKGIARWDLYGSGITALMTELYSTKRAPAITGGKRGTAVTNLTRVIGTPLMPVATELEKRVLPTAAQTFEVFLFDTTSTIRILVDDLRNDG